MITYKVLENHPQDSRIKIKEDGIFQTMGVRGGQEYEPHTLLVLEIRTGEDELLHRERTNSTIEDQREGGNTELYARSTGDYRGGVQ